MNNLTFLKGFLITYLIGFDQAERMGKKRISTVNLWGSSPQLGSKHLTTNYGLLYFLHTDSRSAEMHCLCKVERRKAAFGRFFILEA